MIKLPKVITYLLAGGIVAAIVGVFYEQSLIEESMRNPGFNKAIMFRYLASVLLVGAGGLAFISESKRFPIYSKVFYVLLVLWVVWLHFRHGKQIDPSDIFQAKGPGPYLILSIMFAVTDKARLKLINTILYYGLLSFSIMLVINMTKMGFTFDRYQAWYQLRELTNAGLWILPVVLFSLSDKNKKRALPTLIAFAIIFISSMLMAARSNLIICSLYVIAYLFYRNVFSRRDNFYLIILAAIPLYLTITIILETEYRVIIDRGVKLLESRAKDDTRTTEIMNFLDQLNPDDLIMGAGPDAYWISRGGRYTWLDNQWLLTAWWAGLFPAVIYFLMLFIPMMGSILTLRSEIFVNGFVPLLWILACAGLAIFVNIAPSMIFYVVSLSMGISTYNLVNKEKIHFDMDDDEE